MTDIRLSCSSDLQFFYFHSHGGTRTFTRKDWEELVRMMNEFEKIGAHVTGGLGPRSIQNYEDLPTRTPLHANTPTPSPSPSTPKPKASLDDLI